MRGVAAFGWLVLSLLCALAWPERGGAQAAARTDASDEVARGLFQAGKAAYEAGNYADALSFFEQAHARSGRPQLLFNVGQAADRLRQDDKALEAFRAYLAALPDAPNRGEVEARIRALERAVAERKSSMVIAPVPAEPVAAPTPADTAAHAAAVEPPNDDGGLTRAPTESKPVTQRWWFWTGVGAVVLGGTAVALAVALGGDDSRTAPYYEGNGGSLQGP